MADKELRRMNRAELIEIIYALQQNERELRRENDALRLRLEDRLLRLERAGSIAEAALSLNHIFEDAEQAAQQYLASLAQADELAEQILSDARRQAADILAAAKAQADGQPPEEASARSREPPEEAPPSERNRL